MQFTCDSVLLEQTLNAAFSNFPWGLEGDCTAFYGNLPGWQNNSCIAARLARADFHWQNWWVTVEKTAIVPMMSPPLWGSPRRQQGRLLPGRQPLKTAKWGQITLGNRCCPVHEVLCSLRNFDYMSQSLGGNIAPASL